MSEVLLELDSVHVNFPARKNWLGRVTEQVHALNGMDLRIHRGETLGVVGESGCGKSTLAQLLMGMLKPITGACQRANAAGGMQMVFQDPLVPRSAFTRLAHNHRAGVDTATPQRTGASSAGWRRWRSRWAFEQNILTACRMRFRADSASASLSPGRSLQILTSSCWMNPPARWIFLSRRRSSICWLPCNNSEI